jgi:hypothetical protein
LARQRLALRVSRHYKKHLLPQTSQFEETMIELTMQMKCSEKKARNILITLMSVLSVMTEATLSANQ